MVLVTVSSDRLDRAELLDVAEPLPLTLARCDKLGRFREFLRSLGGEIRWFLLADTVGADGPFLILARPKLRDDLSSLDAVRPLILLMVSEAIISFSDSDGVGRKSPSLLLDEFCMLIDGGWGFPGFNFSSLDAKEQSMRYDGCGVEEEVNPNPNGNVRRCALR